MNADTELRTLTWSMNKLKFPCGVEADISAEKLHWVFKTFKYEINGNELINFGNTKIPKSLSLQLKNYLTK